MSAEDAALFRGPVSLYVQQNTLSLMRLNNNNRDDLRAELVVSACIAPGKNMLQLTQMAIPRYVATPRVAKHQAFRLV